MPVVFLLTGIVLPPVALANEAAKNLIISCKKLEGIYEKRDKQQFLAGLTTSTSDALRAGYCRGVLDEFRRTGDFCAQRDWYKQAVHIASYSAYAEELPSVDSLLRQSCES
jgi:hypothetical protein